MSKSRELDRIICIKEEIKHVNKISRKIYMLALNAMFMSRRAGGAGTGYARVTRELRAFSENLEKSMNQLIVMSATMTDKVSIDVKISRRKRIFKQAITQADKRHGTIDISLKDRVQTNLKVNNNGFSDVSRRLARLRQLARQGQNVAVLAKVEAMHINTDSEVLHTIGDEVSVYVEQVENSMLVAFQNANDTKVAA